MTAAEAAAPRFGELSLRLHAHPEVGLEERLAAGWIGEELRGAGFSVVNGPADLPTAFVATWGREEARPVLAFLAEYDALPELGHACGHNLIAAASSLAAVALAGALSPEEAQVRVIGCPAEESYAGKAQLADRGVFSDVDAALMAHASDRHLSSRPASGRKSVVVEFHGSSAHAAAGPELGVNALDAMILTFNGIALMRQQLRDEARVHGIITDGGKAANTIPDYTRAEFFVRAFDIPYLEELERRLVACARGAAEATGARLEVSSATLTMLPIRRSRTLEARYEENLRFLGEAVGEAPEGGGAGSTDFGNVSQLVPALHAYFKIGEGDLHAHTAPFAEASKSEEGIAGMIVGAKALALTALNVIEDKGLLSQARREFEQTAPGEGGS